MRLIAVAAFAVNFSKKIFFHLLRKSAKAIRLLFASQIVYGYQMIECENDVRIFGFA